MNNFLKSIVTFGVLSLLLINVCRVDGAGPLVSEIGNKHNLSSIGRKPGTTELDTNTSPYRAKGDINTTTTYLPGRQVCIFCHTPHNANVSEQAPLWNRKFSTETFSRYSSATLQIRVNPTARTASGYLANPEAQPDGSSKLCLSCHDGVSSLGVVLRGGDIEMRAGYEKITGLASFKDTTNKMKKGHHPVSFVYNEAVRVAINAGKATTSYSLPTEPGVNLRNSKMQCSTCHDPHQNKSDDTKCYLNDGSVGECTDPLSTGRKVVPFWVLTKGSGAINDHDSVCTTCHPLDGTGMILVPNNPPVTPNPFPVSPL